MHTAPLIDLTSRLSEIAQARSVGRVVFADGQFLRIAGFETEVKLGDRLRLIRRDGSDLLGDVLCIGEDGVTMLPDDPPQRVALADRVVSLGPVQIAPDPSWIGRVIGPYGQALDGRPLRIGQARLNLRNDAPPAVGRKQLGPRLNTGFHLFDTMLPIVRGQRIGIFSGSGVGKSRLIADLVQAMEADVVVIALVGERGREINNFTQNVLGDTGMARSVVVAASADAGPNARFRCPLTAMRVAEVFRDRGQHVLLFVDSITRYAEAQREVAVSAGEFPSLRGFPPSTPPEITKLVERAGPGVEGRGDITAVFSVLVAGSDMNEPVADMLRGVLDGHIVLDRKLADRGRFPAVDVLRSVSRSLPMAASDAENALIGQARKLLASYEDAAALVQSGLYSEGSDAELDQAIAFEPVFQEFAAGCGAESVSASFERLRLCLRRCGALRSEGIARPRSDMSVAASSPLGDRAQ
jgi:flagellum-specific ATP synthase